MPEAPSLRRISSEYKVYDPQVEEEEKILEYELKNLDTNEVFKIPISPANNEESNSARRKA